MVTSRKRRRQLARARWERQQARRSAAQIRHRRIAIVVGVIVALVAAAALVWLILHIVNTEKTRQKEEQTPTGIPTGIPTLLQPTESGTTVIEQSGATGSIGGSTPRNTTVPHSSSHTGPSRHAPSSKGSR